MVEDRLPRTLFLAKLANANAVVALANVTSLCETGRDWWNRIPPLQRSLKPNSFTSSPRLSSKRT